MLLNPDEDGKFLMRRKIVYAPDYVANNRGLWDVYHQLTGSYDLEKVKEGCKKNYPLTFELLERSHMLGIPPHQTADQMAEAIFNKKRE